MFGKAVLWLCIVILAPLVGYRIGGILGLILGLLVGFVGLSILYSGRLTRSISCAICGRSLMNLGRGSPMAEAMNIGTFMRTEGMRRGHEGPGDQCLRCGRIYCTNCADYGMTCICGSTSFQTVRLRYR